MELVYRLAADLVVTLHAAYVLFVVVGFLLVLLGILLKWSWIRNLWFRLAHLAAILVVAEAWLGITCPPSDSPSPAPERPGPSFAKRCSEAMLIEALDGLRAGG